MFCGIWPQQTIVLTDVRAAAALGAGVAVGIGVGTAVGVGVGFELPKDPIEHADKTSGSASRKHRRQVQPRLNGFLRKLFLPQVY